MISFENPLLLLLAIPLVALLVFAQRHAYANLSRRRSQLALGIRIVIVFCLVSALANTSVRLFEAHQAVMFVADLSASDAGQRSSIENEINASASSRPGGDRLGVVSVARQAVVEQPLSGLSSFTGFQSSVDPHYTNLASGLDLANAILPAGYEHRIVLASDGQQNVGDALSTARLLQSQGVRLDVLPLKVPSGPEVLVQQVTAPSQLRANEGFPLGVTIHSNVRTTTGLTLVRDRAVIGSVQKTLVPGSNTFTFQQSPLPPGSHSFTVDIAPRLDTNPENNQGSALATVQSAPQVLVIAADTRGATNVAASLGATGIRYRVVTPAAIPPDLSFLQRYAAVAIVDTSADQLGTSLMQQLVPYVRDLGHGLVVIGGQNSYSMGGYGQTPLEQVLPVRMTLPKHEQQPTTAVALIIESLESDTTVNVSKEAGIAVVNLLGPQDQVAVSDAPFDGTAGWVVPMQHVRNVANIDAAIERMVPGDPDSYTPMLQGAYQALKQSHARIKHIILLGDGDAEDSSYQQVVQSIHAGGVTVSTVSTNGQGRFDYQNMQQIAAWGGGRNYIANDAAGIPQIFLRETRSVARLGIVEGKFYPTELSANPMVHDLTRVAPLYGYLATTPKPAAEIVLASKKLDPVLAAWQYGLGRSVAWTSDSAGLWTKDWLRAPNAARFWANLLSWTFPASGGSQLSVSATSNQGSGQISAAVPSSLGPDPTVTAHVLGPSSQSSTLQLEPVAPGQFSGSFQQGARGAYFVTVEARGAGKAAFGQVGLNVPYSPEYRTTGLNLSFLHLLAKVGGGSVISRPSDVWQNNLPAAQQQYDITVWLLLLAALLLPIDIGARRLVVSRRELQGILDALPLGRGALVPAQTLPLAAALRSRRESLPRSPAASSTNRRSSAGPGQSTLVADQPTRRPGAAPQQPAPAASVSDEQSLAAKLLASRRRRP